MNKPELGDSYLSKDYDESTTIKNTYVSSQLKGSTQQQKKVYICSESTCQKSFRFKSELIRHENVHKNNRPYKCSAELCDKKFKRRDALENHMRKHSGEKPYPCSVKECQDKFSTKANLRYHILQHKNDKPYKCTIPGCEKSFMTIFQLNQHKKSKNIHSTSSKINMNSSSIAYIKKKIKQEYSNNTIIVQDNNQQQQNQYDPLKVSPTNSNQNTQILTNEMHHHHHHIDDLQANSELVVCKKKLAKLSEENKMLKQHLLVCQKLIHAYPIHKQQFQNNK